MIVLAGLLGYQADAQTSAQSSAAQITVNHPLPPEIIAMHAGLKRPVPSVPDNFESAAAISSSNNFNSEQGPGSGPRAGLPGCDVFPAPASVGAKVGLSYFGPPPSTTNPSLVGPVQLLDSGKLDAINGTITLPLYLGYMKGTSKKVWYILSDVSDPGVAAELGLNFSAKMTFMAPGARRANFDDTGDLIFEKGTVDFTPVRNIVPGPPGAEFPPVSATPGEVGDANY
ncbi:MAG: hypothetical protein WA671_00720, partial [Candidatus Sulfotelmatobacter sp.]